MKKLFIILLVLLSVMLLAVSCDSDDYTENPDIPVRKDLQKLIDDADPNSVLELPTCIFVIDDPVVINKPLKVVGAVNKDGTPATVIDYSNNFIDAIKYKEASSPLYRLGWMGAVNIYSGDVNLSNIKIIGDLDKAVEKGPVADKVFFDPGWNANYQPVYGLYICPQAEGGSAISELAGKINISNVEITKTSSYGILINHVGAKEDWYTGNSEVPAAAKDSLVLEKIYIHDIGNIEKTKIGAFGVFFRNSTNVTLKDSRINTGNNGAPVWIHLSEYLGPIYIDNTKLEGKYIDSEDWAFCYKNDGDDSGNFEELESPIMVELQIAPDGTKTLSQLISSKAPADLIKVDSKIWGSEVIPAEIPARKPMWGSSIIALTK